MIRRFAILAAASMMCIAASGPCTGPVNSASAVHACDIASRAGARIDEITSALQALGTPPAKIAPLIADIQAGRAVISTTCAIVQIFGPKPTP